MVRTPKEIFNEGCFLGIFESSAMTDDFFRNRLDQMIDLAPLVAKLAEIVGINRLQCSDQRWALA